MSLGAALYQPFPMLPARRAQVWRHQPSFLRPRHFHEEPEINWVMAGQARMGVGARSVLVHAGDVLLLAPGVDHVLLEASADFDLFVSALTPELAARALDTPLATFAGEAALDEPRRRALAAELAGLAEVRDPATHEARLGALFRETLRSAAPRHALSRRAVAGVQSDPGVSQSALARRLHTAPSGMSRQFQSDLGVSFVSYRARVRLMRFIEHVDRGESFLRAALEASFGSYAQCHRVFRRTLGCSPKEYFAGARARIDAATCAGDVTRRAKPGV